MNIGRQRKFFFVALTSVALLTALPATGWIVRLQLRLLGGQAFTALNSQMGAENSHPDAKELAVSAAHPNDFERQLALAVQTSGDFDAKAPDGIGSPTVKALLSLQPRFGNQPKLSAHILRFLTSSDLKIARRKDALRIEPDKLQTDLAKPSNGESVMPPRPEAIALALKTAQQGGELDPANGFFPTMRAVALFAAHRDGKAADALSVAAQKPHWNDYTADEARARWLGLQDAMGEPGAIPRQATAAAILLPQYSQIREMARLAISLAIQKEVAGDTAGGFRLRQSVAHLGGLMRAKSNFIIGNFVGMTIVSTAALRPDNAAYIASRPDDIDHAEREAQYVAYLAKIGHPKEARWYVAECQAGAKVKAIYNAAMRETNNDLQPALYLAGWWSGGVLLLLTTAWMLALGGFATWLAGRKSIRAGKPFRFAVRASGIAVAVLLAAWIAALTGWMYDLLNGDATVQVEAIAATCLLVGLLAVLLKRLWRGQTRRYVTVEILKGLGAIVATAAIVAVLIALSGLSCAGIIHSIMVLLAIANGNYGAGDGTMDTADTLITEAVAGGIVLLIPLMTMLILAIRSRVRRVPITVGIVRGMRAVALPIASALLLAYALTLVGTQMEETYASAALEQTTTNAGEHAASVAQQDWPKLTTLDRDAPPPAEPSLN